MPLQIYGLQQKLGQLDSANNEPLAHSEQFTRKRDIPDAEIVVEEPERKVRS